MPFVNVPVLSNRMTPADAALCIRLYLVVSRTPLLEALTRIILIFRVRISEVSVRNHEPVASNLTVGRLRLRAQGHAARSMAEARPSMSTELMLEAYQSCPTHTTVVSSR